MKYILNLVLSYIAFWKVNPPRIGEIFLTGYGRVNSWASGSLFNLRRDICRCAAEGVAIYNIELAGWIGSNVYVDPKLLVKIEKRYKFAVRLCRAFGMYLFVSILNGNQGKGKYGDTSPTIAKGWDIALKLLDIVKENGHDNILAQPVAETQDDGGRRFEILATNDLHCRKFITVNNNGSRPSSSAGMTHFAWHPFKISDINKAPISAIIVSDTGTIVCELGDGLSGSGNPAQLKTYKSVCKNRGCPASVYYAFLYNGHDKRAIEALGN